MNSSLPTTMADVECQARRLMMGDVSHEQWCFAFGDWFLDDTSEAVLLGTLHRWNTDSMTPMDEKFMELVVSDAMEAASIFLTEKPLEEAFKGLDTDKWADDFTNSLIKVNL